MRLWRSSCGEATLVCEKGYREKAEMSHGKNLNGGTYPFAYPIPNEKKKNIINLSLSTILCFSPLSSSLLLEVAQMHMETAVLLRWSSTYGTIHGEGLFRRLSKTKTAYRETDVTKVMTSVIPLVHVFSNMRKRQGQ